MITSADNPRIKQVIRLNAKAKERREQRSFVCEGRKLFQETPPEMRRQVFVSESFWKEAADDPEYSGCEVVADRIFRKMCDTQTPQGILTVAQMPAYNREDLLVPGKDGRITLLILENVQDPGNVGTILRTAEAAGVSGVILNTGCADLFQPKTVRATMGSIYRVPFLIEKDLSETAGWLKAGGITLLAAELQASRDFREFSGIAKKAWIMGNEGRGITPELLRLADDRIRIPMHGKVESLNVAIAAAILIFDK